MTYRNMGCALGVLVLRLLMSGIAHSAPAELDNPQLSVSRAQSAVLLSWPDWATNWAVEESAQLQADAAWTPLASGTNKLRRDIQPATNGFFRLRKLSPTIAGLSGYWRFDEGTGASAGDDVPNAPAVFFTNATWRAGRVGPQALRFNGGSAAVSASKAWVTNSNYSVLPSNGQPFSVSMWFSPEALTNVSQLLVGNGTSGWTVALQSPGPGTNYLVLTSGSLTITGRALLLPGQWYELTLTYDGSQARLYLDANLLASGTGPVTTDDRQIFVGGGVAGYNSFLGRIDEVRAYKTALTDERISLTGYWSFDEAVGTVAYDKSIFGHHGKLSAPSWTTGKVGTGVQVSSNEMIIDNPYYTALPPSGSPFSISLWLYPYSLPVGRSGLMSAGTNANSNWELALEVDAAGQATVAWKSAGGSGTLDMRAPIAISNRAWTKLDLTYDGATAAIYANGRKIHQDSGLIQSGRVPLHIGRVPGLSNFDGVIDELKVYRRERGASEIGPVATVMWETVLRGSSTNLLLQGSGPAGKTLTYSILNAPTPTNGTLTHIDSSSAVGYQAGNRKGPDALIYAVSDGEFTSVPATLHLSVVEPHWISPSGGSVQPLDGSTPQQAWSAGSADALDAIWHTNTYYDCFFYAPGLYETRGCRVSTRGTANPGCKHVGSGSEGPQATTIRVIGMSEAWNEENIFAPVYWDLVDDFEVHNLVLDCNAENNPKYAQGESVWITVPLTNTALVHSLTIRWNVQSVPGSGPIPWHLGAARDFRICTRSPSPAGYITNCVSRVSTGQVDVVSLEALTDQIVIQLDRRNQGIDFYSIADIQLTGGNVALPLATRPDGAESRLDPANLAYSIRQAFDGNDGTAWASGSETNVQIAVPVDPLTPATSLRLHWNCQTIPGGLQLGPASEYVIRARHPETGQFDTVPFTRQPRTPDGVEENIFSSPVQTDQLVIELTAREPDAQVYSLREVALQNNGTPTPFRIPAALSTSPFFENPSILQAFDGAPETTYVSFTQGMIGAIAVAGNNLKFTHLKVIGFGTKAGRECFALWAVNYKPTQQVGNVVIEDCLFTAPATNNAEGITCVSLLGKDGSITNGIIRRCTVRGLAQAFVYDNHAFRANVIENCLVEDCQQGVYFEPDFATDYIGPVTIRSNRFNNVRTAVLFRFWPARQFGPITCADNEMVLTGGGGWGCAAGDIYSPGRSASITNVTLLRNVIRYLDWQPRPTYGDGGMLYSDIQNGVFVNNVVALGTASSLRVRQCPLGSALAPSSRQQCSPNPPIEIPGEDAPPCLNTLPAGYRRVWLGNRDLSGSLLQVRFNNSNVDGPALQQQPPNELP